MKRLNRDAHLGSSREVKYLPREELMTRLIFSTAALIATATSVFAQSPAATESKTINGKAITISYSSPRVNGREGKLFGKDGLCYRSRRFGSTHARQRVTCLREDHVATMSIDDRGLPPILR